MKTILAVAILILKDAVLFYLRWWPILAFVVQMSGYNVTIQIKLPW